MNTTLWTRNRALAATALAAWLLAMPLPVFAHAVLVATVPAQEEAVGPAPHELRLTFSEGVELAFSKVTIVGADNAEIATDALSLDPADSKTVIVPIKAELAPGAYTVNWTVVSADGHKIEGSYSMNVAP